MSADSRYTPRSHTQTQCECYRRSSQLQKEEKINIFLIDSSSKQKGLLSAISLPDSLQQTYFFNAPHIASSDSNTIRCLLSISKTFTWSFEPDAVYQWIRGKKDKVLDLHTHLLSSSISLSPLQLQLTVPWGVRRQRSWHPPFSTVQGDSSPGKTDHYGYCSTSSYRKHTSTSK